VRHADFDSNLINMQMSQQQSMRMIQQPKGVDDYLIRSRHVQKSANVDIDVSLTNLINAQNECIATMNAITRRFTAPDQSLSIATVHHCNADPPTGDVRKKQLPQRQRLHISLECIAVWLTHLFSGQRRIGGEQRRPEHSESSDSSDVSYSLMSSDNGTDSRLSPLN